MSKAIFLHNLKNIVFPLKKSFQKNISVFFNFSSHNLKGYLKAPKFCIGQCRAFSRENSKSYVKFELAPITILDMNNLKMIISFCSNLKIYTEVEQISNRG